MLVSWWVIFLTLPEIHSLIYTQKKCFQIMARSIWPNLTQASNFYSKQVIDLQSEPSSDGAEKRGDSVFRVNSEQIPPASFPWSQIPRAASIGMFLHTFYDRWCSITPTFTLSYVPLSIIPTTRINGQGPDPLYHRKMLAF